MCSLLKEMGSLRAAYNYVTKDESFRAVLPVYVCFFFISVSMYGGSNIQVIVLDSAGTPEMGKDASSGKKSQKSTQVEKKCNNPYNNFARFWLLSHLVKDLARHLQGFIGLAGSSKKTIFSKIMHVGQNNACWTKRIVDLKFALYNNGVEIF